MSKIKEEAREEFVRKIRQADEEQIKAELDYLIDKVEADTVERIHQSKKYAKVFVSEPFWDGNKWDVWTSCLPIEGGYQIRIPIPEKYIIELQDAEIIEDDTVNETTT